MANEPDLVISAGFSDAKLVQDSNKVVAEFRKRGEEAQKAFQDATGRVTNTSAAKAHARELDRLSRAYDPVYRAAKQYESEVKKLDRALDVGAITQGQYTGKVAEAARQMQQATGATDSFSSAASRARTGVVAMDRGVQAADKSTRQFRSQVQNSAFQLQDFVVQVQGGTRASVAFAQQAPQLLGGFGAAGAVIGLFAALAVPVGAALLSMAGGGKSLEDQMKDLTKTTDDMTSAIDLAATPVDVLRSSYGDLADEISRVNIEGASFAATLARIDLQKASQGTARSLLNLPVINEQFLDGDVRNENRREQIIQSLARSFRIAAEDAETLLDQVQALDKADGPEDVVKATDALLQLYTKMPDAADKYGKQISALNAIFQQATRQIALQAAAEASLIREYQTNTDKMNKLADDRELAQKMLDKAIRSGSEDAIDLAEERIGLIDREIQKTRDLARETDSAFQGMLRAYQQYGDSRRQGMEWSQSPAGYEAQYTASRARGDDGAERELVRAVVGLAERMDVSARDLLAVMSFETGGKLRPDVMGPTTKWGQHFGLIQFGEPQGAQYGVSPSSSITQQVEAAGRYLQDAGVKAGDSLANIYAAVLAGDARKIYASDLAAGGVVGNVSDATGGAQFAPHLARADGLLAAQGGVQREVQDAYAETQRLLKEESRAREQLAKQAEDYGKQLAANLVTEEQSADLARQQAQQVYEIKRQGLGENEEAAAIAAVNAQIERQRTIFALTAEAKQRNVDLDAMLADGTMSYRDAIISLADAKALDIVLTQQREQALADTADRIQDIEAQSKRGESALQGMFGSIIDGSMSAKDAVIRLLMEIAKIQAIKGFMGLPGMGQASTVIGGLLGMNSDPLSGALRGIGLPARAMGGPVSAGQAYMVGEEGPEPFVPAVNGRILSVPQAQAAVRDGGRSGGVGSVALTLDLRGTTGDRELDAKFQRAGQELLARVPAMIDDIQKRDK